MLEKRAYTNIRLHYKFYKNPEDCKENKDVINYCLGNQNYKIVLDSNSILKVYYDSNKCQEYDLQKHVGSRFKVTGISTGNYPIYMVKGSNNICILYHCHYYEETNTNYGFTVHNIKICVNKYYEYLYKFVNWFWLNIIDNIFIIPRYTELDAMPDGWRNSFGMQMCKDIRHSLLHTYIDKETTLSPFNKLKLYWKGIKMLYAYRIEQIKEKLGYLHWYDCNTTTDIQKIIGKYEDISMKTCIVCGKPATYISRGWISPYCDEHIKDKDYATRIKNS